MGMKTHLATEAQGAGKVLPLGLCDSALGKRATTSHRGAARRPACGARSTKPQKRESKLLSRELRNRVFGLFSLTSFLSRWERRSGIWRLAGIRAREQGT